MELVKAFPTSDMGYAWLIYIAHFYHYKSPMFGMFDDYGQQFCEEFSKIPIKVSDNDAFAKTYNLDYEFTKTPIYLKALERFLLIYVKFDNIISSYLAKKEALTNVNDTLKVRLSIEDATKYKSLSSLQTEILADIDKFEKEIFNGKFSDAGRRFLLTMNNIYSF